MRYSYDISTKDKEISYVNLVDKYLLDLGFGFNKNGTKYLRDLILTAYFLQDYKFEIKHFVKEFFEINKITAITQKEFIKCINYSINNVDSYKSKDNFYQVFGVHYDFYYFTTRNMVILFLRLLEKTER